MQLMLSHTHQPHRQEGALSHIYRELPATRHQIRRKKEGN